MLSFFMEVICIILFTLFNDVCVSMVCIWFNKSYMVWFSLYDKWSIYDFLGNLCFGFFDSELFYVFFGSL